MRQADPSQEEPAPVDVKPEQGEEVKEAAAEEALFAGLTAAELKGLLAKSAQVDSLQESLRKEHGKLGELNAKIDELMKGRATAPAAQTAADEGPSEKNSQRTIRISPSLPTSGPTRCTRR